MAAGKSAAWLWLTVPVVALDQATKFVVEHQTPEDHVRTVIPGFFDLVHRHNRGVAFSMFADADSPWLTPLLIGFAVVVMAMLVWLLATDRAGGRRARAGLALILGGAAGNLIDRLLHGSVIDFLDFYVGSYHYPAFNVADSCIVIGAGLVILELLFEGKARDVETLKG
jgi:signal peptidase II